MSTKKADELEIVVNKLHATIYEIDTESALEGLTLLTLAFGVILDIYAMPNENNPEGMCDSKEDFRKYFANILVTSIPQKRRHKCESTCTPKNLLTKLK